MRVIVRRISTIGVMVVSCVRSDGGGGVGGSSSLMRIGLLLMMVWPVCVGVGVTIVATSGIVVSPRSSGGSGGRGS